MIMLRTALIGVVVSSFVPAMALGLPKCTPGFFSDYVHDTLTIGAGKSVKKIEVCVRRDWYVGPTCKKVLLKQSLQSKFECTLNGA